MKRNPIARDLRTPKYRQRVVPSKRPDAKPDHWSDNPKDEWRCGSCNEAWEFDDPEINTTWQQWECPACGSWNDHA
ncbi:MAG TPA: hypothetical protein VKQ30_20725 [Ktedonobacterales bacterium]|nr:hypothetical protein [Ktedonobacterales bacterium]